MNYLRNCWYVAAWSDEVSDALLARTFLDQPVVLFRDEKGVAHALMDRCPHRLVPLSMGKHEGSSIRCAYHGLEFNGAGKCIHNPFGAVPDRAQVKTYPLAERHGMLWIWMGAADRADVDLVPDFSFNDPVTHHVAGGHLMIESNYKFATENILDLSHVSFVHRDSIGAIFSKPDHESAQMVREGDSIWCNRTYVNFRFSNPAGSEVIGGDADTLYSRTVNVRWNAPACMFLKGEMTRADGTPIVDPGNSQFIEHTHIFTPETDRTTHYWFGASYPRAFGESYGERVRNEAKYLYVPFENEDGPMLAAQQAGFGDTDFWDARPIILEGDAAGMHARRSLEKMIREEARESQREMVDA